MTLEETLKSLKTAFSGKSAEAEAMSKEIAALKSQVETLNAEKALVIEQFNAAEAKAAESALAIAKVEELNKALATAEAQKVAAVSQIESVGKVAAKMVAAVGAAPVEINPAETAASPKTNAEVWEEFMTMKDAAKKQAFYNANRGAIIAHLGIK
jgi:predicted  nucleic acid-binding Zn-ribbon protein